MRVWRLVTGLFIKDAFTGEGARIAGGRWNPKGVPVVYTASSLSLAALELLVHTDADLLPDDLQYFAVDIPDDIAISTVAIDSLPSNWRAYPAPEALQNIGAEWIAKGRSAVLSVSSAVIPEENNYLLNPLHADFSRIRWEKPKPFYFDTRLRRGK
jgi:RES domain-containing protein